MHLEADVHRVIRWADSNERPWAFSNGNAGTRYTQFYGKIEQLDLLDWNAINAIQWNAGFVKEGKQAEFLVAESFPWELVERIGVIDKNIEVCVADIIRGAAHLPEVAVERSWYY